MFLQIFPLTVDKTYKVPVKVVESVSAKTSQLIFDREKGMVSVGLIVDYIISQCYIWREWENWKYRFSLSWVFGSKAIDRFYTQKPGVKYYQDIWLSEFGLDREKFKTYFDNIGKEHPMRKYIYMESEEYSKSRFINTDMGYALCVQSTLLWSPMSKWCTQCSNATRCKELLIKTYPELYRLRIEK